MPKTKKNNYMPRKMLKSERPRETRSVNLKNAYQNLHENYDKFLRQVEKLQPKVDKHNKRVDTQIDKRLQSAAKRAKKRGKFLSGLEAKKIEALRISRYRYAYQEIKYEHLNDYLAQLEVCEPDIDSISTSHIQPGGIVEICGTCFGPAHGKVFLEIQSNNLVELEVEQWSQTSIRATLNRLIGEVPLRPYYGKIWIQTGNDLTSNVWPIMYKPIRAAYMATWTKDASGGGWGYSKDDIFLKDCRLGDDFIILHVGHNHWGDGWSKLQYPFASGQNMAQGWHIGVDVFKNAHMNISYEVVGPKGISPTEFDELSGGYWQYLYDVD